jgi:hypothetical protein
MRQVHVFFILSLATMGSACDEVQKQFHREKNVCPTQLVAAPQPGAQKFNGLMETSKQTLPLSCLSVFHAAHQTKE